MEMRRLARASKAWSEKPELGRSALVDSSYTTVDTRLGFYPKINESNPMRVYLLGAGASYGYDTTLPSISVPPLTNEFFSKGVKWEILTESRYPSLINRLKLEYRWEGTNQKDDLAKIQIDIEPFLAKLGREFEEGKPYAQGVLGETAYFILDLLKRYAITGRNSFDCYRHLALSYLNTPFYVITLNYDVLLESAANAVGLSYSYGEPVPPQSIPIAKPHGSISWLNPIGHGIALGGLKSGDTTTAARYIYSNVIKTARPVMLPVQNVVALRDLDIVRSGNDYYEPIIVPPQGEFKDYRKFSLIEEVWRWAQEMINFADEIVIVGCSLRQEDSRLWNLITSLRANANVTIVNPSAEELERGIFERNSKVQLQSPFKSFEDFVKTL